MKLAEALIIRADANKRLLQLRERLAQSAQAQEGDTPPEQPAELMAELERTLDTFTALVKSINRTNFLTPFESGNLTDALAERDSLALQRNTLSELVQAAAGRDTRARYPRSISTIKYFRTFDVASVQKRIDDLSRSYRDLDARIQAVNWSVTLVE
jgi:hypothetical protein